MSSEPSPTALDRPVRVGGYGEAVLLAGRGSDLVLRGVADVNVL